MYLTTARQIVRSAARNANDRNVYGDFDIDVGIQTACQRFCRFTKSVKTVSQLALANDTAALPSFPAGFQPEMLLRAWMNNTEQSDLEIVSDSEMRHRMRRSGDPSGTRKGKPWMLAFNSLATGNLYPLPDSGSWPTDATMYAYFWWWNEFTAFPAGSQGAYSSSVNYYIGDVVSYSGNYFQAIQAAINQTPAAGTYWIAAATAPSAPATLALNIPDAWITPILQDGAASKVMLNLKEHADLAAAKWEAYLKYESSMCGMGDLGEKDSRVESEWSRSSAAMEEFFP